MNTAMADALTGRFRSELRRRGFRAQADVDALRFAEQILTTLASPHPGVDIRITSEPALFDSLIRLGSWSR